MTLIFTVTDGRNFTIKDVKQSDRVTISYKDKDGNEVIRYINITANGKLQLS